MMGTVHNLGPWSWVILGIALMGLELLAPGVFFLWLGFGALLTGLVDWAFDLSWPAAALTFAVLSAASVYGGRLLTRDRRDPKSGGDNLNRRGPSLIGRVFVLDAPITRDGGRIRVDDSSWRVLGPELPAGASVKVVSVDGTNLRVEAA